MPPDKQKHQFTQRTKRVLGVVSIVIFLLLSAVIAWFVGRPMLRFVSEPQLFRDWVDDKGFLGMLAFIGMMALQVIVAIIPGEPLEIGAGYAFGAIEGTLLCLIGIVLGSAVIFGLVRRFGIRLIEVFFPIEKIRSLRFLREKRKLNTITFIVMFIPGTPKDLLSYAVGLTDMKFSTWLLISGIARIPSVVTSTVGGDALGSQNYIFAIITFAVTGVVSVAGLLFYNWYNKRHADSTPSLPQEDGADKLPEPSPHPQQSQGAPQTGDAHKKPTRKSKPSR